MILTKERLNKDSIIGTMVFTVVLCLICSFMITGTVELLKERKLVKKRDEVKRNVVLVADIDVADGTDFRQAFDSLVTPKLIDLNSGAAQSLPVAEIMDFDAKMASVHPETSMKPKKDTAKIRSRAADARVFIVSDKQGNLDKIVLPIYGKGLWSMLYGYIALEADMNTISNIVIYEHGETAGIGDFLNETQWTDQFRGKQIFDDKGKVAFKVVKGGAKEGDIHGVDGVSGATMSARGVQRAIQFWFSSEGFEPLLSQLKASGV